MRMGRRRLSDKGKFDDEAESRLCLGHGTLPFWSTVCLGFYISMRRSWGRSWGFAACVGALCWWFHAALWPLIYRVDWCSGAYAWMILTGVEEQYSRLSLTCVFNGHLAVWSGGLSTCLLGISSILSLGPVECRASWTM